MKYIRSAFTGGMLSLRKWLLIVWLTYAFFPAVPIGLATGVGWLLLRRDPTHEPVAAALIVGLAVAVQISIPVMTAWLTGRFVLRPLAALSRASRQIAAGDLAFELPQTRVRELAEVSAAFTAMGDDLRLSITRQAALEQERRFFISAVAHDLRSPLFSLRGYLEGLEQGIATTPEKAAHYLAVCREKADELDRLVTDLFAYSQLEYLDQQPSHELLDLSALMAHEVEGVRPLAETRDLRFHLEGPACMLMGDRHLLGRAVTNLLDNAIQHSPVGGTITIRWEAKEQSISLSIADMGAGIDPRDLPHLFEPLFRGEASRNRQTGGAGLGLAITQRIIRAHGGELSATNLPDGGACFTTTLACEAAISPSA